MFIATFENNSYPPDNLTIHGKFLWRSNLYPCTPTKPPWTSDDCLLVPVMSSMPRDCISPHLTPNNP